MAGQPSWRRNPKRGTQQSFVEVLCCPDDQVLGVPLYQCGRSFDRTSFAESLRDGCYPCGMQVGLWIQRKRYQFMIYRRRTGQYYLHQTDEEGYLTEDGLEMDVIGSDGSGYLRRRVAMELPLMQAVV
jgi:hypothetical protein